MTQIVIEKIIDAPIGSVFSTIANIGQFSKAIPHVVKFEYLSEKKSGIGNRFLETRIMKGKESVTELEIVEYIENDSIRMVTDSHGTVWDTLFSVRLENGKTVLNMTMDARAHRLLPKLLNPLLKGLFKTAIKKDLELVKAFCENT